MQTQHPCLDCMFNQGERTAKRIFGERPEYFKVIKSLRELVDQQPPEGPPPVFFSQIYQIVAEAAGEPDPFKQIKAQNTQAALRLYPYLKRLVAESHDPMETATLIAIAGNIIDHGAVTEIDPERELELTLSIQPKVMDYTKFKNAVANAHHILYLGDNAGETVYDRVLIETIDKPTTFAVRPRPIINDATREDAIQAGIDHIAEIVSTGSDTPGIDLNQVSAEFRGLFDNSDMIISKGMGNFETLSDVKRPIFFLLKAKCDLVADHMGVQVGDSVLYASNVS